MSKTLTPPTLLAEADAMTLYGSSLKDNEARKDFARMRTLTATWECYAYTSAGRTLVCMMRPLTGPLNVMDGRLTIETFEALSAFALDEALKIEEAIAVYLTMLYEGWGAIAGALLSIYYAGRHLADDPALWSRVREYWPRAKQLARLG